MNHKHELDWSLFIASWTPLGRSRGELEDEIEELLGDVAQVSGGGQGAGGWNIDIDLLEPESLEWCIARIQEYLRSQRVPADTVIDIVRRERRAVYD